MNSDLISKKGVSIDRLRSFCAVIEAGSITAAAAQDPSKQSQFSRQITELEDALGVELFERINRRLSPTEAGRALALMTRSYFDGLAELSNSGGAKGETIRIAAAESTFESLVYPRLSGMRSASPSCRFVFESCGTEDAVQRLKTGRVDIAIVRDNAPTEDMDTILLTEVDYALAIPRNLLPQGNRGGFESLRDLPMVVLRGGGEFRRMLATITEKAGVDLLTVAETDSFGGAFELVRTGVVAAILPKWMTKSLSADKFATVESEEFAVLVRSLVVATAARTKSLRPLIGSAATKLASVWRP